MITGVSLLTVSVLTIGIDALTNLFVHGKLLIAAWSPILAAVFIPAAVLLFIVNASPELKAYFIKKFHI